MNNQATLTDELAGLKPSDNAFAEGTASETISISGLTNGIYFYKILAADKSILSSGKITIIK